MERHGISGGTEEAAGSRLESWINRILRCRHRHKSLPFTPRGEKEPYAVCLDCGQRLAPDMLLISAPLSASREMPKAGGSREHRPDKSRSVPRQPETASKMASVLHHAAPPWKHDMLWLGLFVAGLSGGLYFSAQNHSRGSDRAAQKPAEPLAGESHIAKQELSAHVQLSPSAPPAGLKSGTTGPRASDGFSRPAGPAGSERTYRLQGKSSVVVLGLDAPAVFELSQHPDRLAELIQGGSLFTVPRGTAARVEVTGQGIVKVLILDGSMAGREGWVSASQLNRL